MIDKSKKVGILLGVRDIIAYQVNESGRFDFKLLNPSRSHQKSDGCILRLNSSNRNKDRFEQIKKEILRKCRVLYSNKHSHIIIADVDYLKSLNDLQSELE